VSRPRRALGTRSKLGDRQADHPPDGDPLGGHAGAVERERRSDAGEGGLVGPHRSGERVAAKPGDEIGSADDEARLWSPDELVAREGHEVGAGRQSLGRHRLVGQAEGRAVEQRP
jgi:hypothetical protein